MVLNEKQLHSLQISERVSSVISLVGCFFIFATFCSSSAFRKPINRLIFYASFGNILTTVAMFIAREGVEAGKDSALCQLQAFFIQQWMPADPLWSLCMALNVWFTFYERFTVARLRSLEWKYFVLCYGVPLIPNLALFFIRTKEKGRIYGPALLWCSITHEWQFLRIVCFYAPVWFISFATLAIFLKVGLDVFHADRNIRHVPHSHDLPTPPPQPHLHTRTPSLPIHKATTVEIHRELVSTSEVPLASNDAQTLISTSPSTTTTSAKSPIKTTKPPPSIITIAPLTTSSSASGPTRSTSNPTRNTSLSSSFGVGVPSIPSPTSPYFTTPSTITTPYTSPIARSYLHCSLLFFAAMVVTWLPSSINRVYSLIRPDRTIYPLNLAAAIVLPLQGFWNSLIYLKTSLPIIRDLWNARVMAPIRRRRRSRGRSRSIGTGRRKRWRWRERLIIASTTASTTTTGSPGDASRNASFAIANNPNGSGGNSNSNSNSNSENGNTNVKGNYNHNNSSNRSKIPFMPEAGSWPGPGPGPGPANPETRKRDDLD